MKKNGMRKKGMMMEKDKPGMPYMGPGTAPEKSTGTLESLTDEMAVPGIRVNTVKEHNPQMEDPGIKEQVTFRDGVHKRFPPTYTG